jgi:hypothetical protein
MERVEGRRAVAALTFLARQPEDVQQRVMDEELAVFWRAAADLQPVIALHWWAADNHMGRVIRRTSKNEIAAVLVSLTAEEVASVAWAELKTARPVQRLLRKHVSVERLHEAWRALSSAEDRTAALQVWGSDHAHASLLRRAVPAPEAVECWGSLDAGHRAKCHGDRLAAAIRRHSKPGANDCGAVKLRVSPEAIRAAA